MDRVANRMEEAEPEEVLLKSPPNGVYRPTTAVVNPVVNGACNGDATHRDTTSLRCGLGSCCSPSWAQRFANKQTFLVVFCLSSVLQGMYTTYFATFIWTIERLFHVSSKTIGYLLSGTKVGEVVGALLLIYYGGLGHRPRWIGHAMVLFSLSFLLFPLPHFIYDVHNNATVSNASSEQCNNHSAVAESPPEEATQKQAVTMVIMAISLLGCGIGYTAAHTLGLPYLDDNVHDKESLLYMAISIGMRVLGPTFGSYIGTLCARVYVDPLEVPPENKQEWIPAWWLGPFLISIPTLFASLLMYAFPRSLKPFVGCENQQQSNKNNNNNRNNNRALRHFKVFPKSVFSLLKNDILVYRTLSAILHIMPIAGFLTFFPKYLESQFHFTVDQAPLISGTCGVFVNGVGIFLSGVFLKRVRREARSAAAWLAICAFVYAAGMVLLMFLGCENVTVDGVDNQTGLQTENASPACNCTYKPVCLSNNITYYCPCLAECKDCLVVPTSQGVTENYTNCMDSLSGTSGTCHPECSTFPWYLVVYILVVLFHATSEVGGYLIIFRCVQNHQKTLALGLFNNAMLLLGHAPAPNLYGAVIDHACAVFDGKLGQNETCLLYRNDVFRYYFHGVTGAILFLAGLVDLIVWHKVKKSGLRLQEDVEDESTDL